MNKVVQSLWVGSRLSAMERLCIASFLCHGHEFHLYTYEDVQDVPKSVVIEDANSILPQSMIFMYKDYASYAGFADFFRHKLMLDKGGWWVDMDLVCLRPFNFETEYVFSSETKWPGGDYRPNAGAVKVPPSSPAFAFIWEQCQRVNPKTMDWGQAGPYLIAWAVEHFALQQYVQAPDVFCPVRGEDWKQMLDPKKTWDFSNAHAVHLWNELWRREGLDKDAVYLPDCLYERLKRKHL